MNMTVAEERSETSVLKVFLVISIILFLGTGAVLNFTVNNLRTLIHEQSRQIDELTQQISDLHNELDLLKESVHNATATSVLSYAGLYDAIKDSVVLIECKVIRQTIFGEAYESVSGSGFVYDYNGKTIVITNDHVVRGGVNVTVSFLNGDTYPSNVLGEDPYSDLAVLTVHAPAYELKPLVIASSSKLEVGDPVVAVGNPFGLTGSMTAGLISQLGRSLQETATGGYMIADIIQISVPINPGNSGGPLLNVHGEVVGITTAIVASSQGVGFAVPSDTILRELPYLVENKPYPHPWLGVKGTDITYEIAKRINLNVTYGWLIIEVLPGSPAEKAGLKGGTKSVNIDGTTLLVGGDVITAINGTRIRNGDDLAAYLERNTKPGQQIQVTVIRAGHKTNISVTLGTRPPSG